MANEGNNSSQPEVPHLGEAGYFCIELSCGSGNLTYAMKHFFPDSFGVDHKVGKQRVTTICLYLSVDSNQQLVEQWCLSGRCLWVHWGIPCGTASRARFRRVSRKSHGPPPLRSDRWPDGVPFLKGLNLVRVRLSNRLYSFMSRLIPKLHQRNIVWTGKPMDELAMENFLPEAFGEITSMVLRAAQLYVWRVTSKTYLHSFKLQCNHVACY